MSSESSPRREPRGEGLAPGILTALALVGAGFFVLPFLALLLRAPLSGEVLARTLRDPVTRQAMLLSLGVATLATAGTIVFGAPLAWLLARHRFSGRGLLRGVVALPMVLPPVVAGVALLTALGRSGLLGRPLAALGIVLPFHPIGAVVAAAFVSAPLFILTAEAALAGADRGLEDAAATLGATRWTILRTVTAPAVLPAFVAGAVLAWARALGEFGATITFAGNLRGRTQTVPLAVYETLQTDPDRAILLALLLFIPPLLVLALLRGRVLTPGTGRR